MMSIRLVHNSNLDFKYFYQWISCTLASFLMSNSLSFDSHVLQYHMVRLHYQLGLTDFTHGHTMQLGDTFQLLANSSITFSKLS